MTPFLRFTGERTLRHYHPHNWARHVLLPCIAAATFSSSPSTDTVGTEAHPKRPSVLERNKLQDYLDLVKSSKEPTAEDIERHRPPKHAPPGNRQYEIDYEGLVQNLSRSFTVKQLQKAHGFFGLERPRRQTKRNLAVSIIERHWKWPSLSDSMKQRKDRTEIITQTFPLDTRGAFLLLGKDGSNLHMLSRKYNVRTSFVSTPLSLAVKGVRGSVERLARYISTFKTDIAEDVIQLPTAQDVAPELCQRVSRLSGALVESQNKQTFRVTYSNKEPRTSHVAKALMLRGAYESSDFPSLLVGTSKDRLAPPSDIGGISRGFSLYPFIPTRSLPWNVDNGGIFRMRDVGWFDFNEMKRTNLRSHDHLTMDNDGKIEGLRKRLLIGVEDTVHNSFQASLGHLLLCVPSTASNILTPPVTGNSPMLELLQKMKRLEKQQVFMPSIPKHLLEIKPHRQRLVHRLIYHAIPRDQKNTEEKTANLMPIESIKLEFGHDFSSSATAATEGYMNTDDDSVAETDDLPSDDEETLSISESGFWRGTQSLVDLMLPERAMDLQFSIANLKETPESSWPTELREYKEAFHELSVSSLNASRANLPLIFSDNGTTFVLRSSTLIRQSTDRLFRTNKKVASSEVVNESILDLTSNERYVTCKIACEDPSSDKSWEQFLHACDSLTADAKQNHS